MCRRCVTLIVIFLTFITGNLLFGERILRGIGDYLVIRDPLQPADVIHVIAGPDYRTEYAIWLYQHGYAQAIYFTGGWCPYHHVNHSLHSREMALRQGVPAEAIFINEEKITSTYTEAGKLEDWISLHSEPIDSIIVVCDPFHTRRARWTYRQLFGDQVKIQMAPVPFEQTPLQRTWWQESISRKYVMDEYGKMVYYWLRYQVQWPPAQSWLISLDRE